MITTFMSCLFFSDRDSSYHANLGWMAGGLKGWKIFCNLVKCSHLPSWNVAASIRLHCKKRQEHRT